ncbi:Transcriptional regulatory protein FixJ [Caulifigura coniformis]|uniref:Transcriptional regulatory protein FixJ n=1 Tax=Caulifigura coniformis TaxID=2527983 RepID=A0A517SB84_9PLAN|nr:response regulator transcription factor [Caulifigura coniformis]QDT53385.1 Transcriptional regulatory protein FixJ [Caulifigura coniformis]
MIDAIELPQPLSVAGPAERDRPVRVLLVEDEPAHVRIAQRAFESREPSPFQLLTASTVASARDAIAASKPDLVIADVILPDGRGIDLIPSMDARSYGVVIMTAQGDEATAVEALKRGALDYVVKSADSLVGLPEVAQRAIRVWEHIEARRTAEERLREEEGRLTAVLAAIPDLIFIVSRTGRFMDCRGGKRLFGADAAAEYVGRHLPDVVGADSLPALRASIDEVLATQEIRDVVFEMMHRGERRFVEARVAPYSEENVVAILHDVTDRHLISSRMTTLSEREREVLRMVAGGASNKQIAARLDLSIKTVEAHRSRLMKKLGAKNMAELMQLAMTVKEDL